MNSYEPLHSIYEEDIMDLLSSPRRTFREPVPIASILAQSPPSTPLWTSSSTPSPSSTPASSAPASPTPSRTSSATHIYAMPASETTSGDIGCVDFALNADIKTGLTEMLNHESVKNDRELRGWIQRRLMEVEMQMRVQRRKRRREIPAGDVVQGVMAG
ncbi:hypothetical protein B0A48_13456 [Cryoendolithus antarcticus]|uniref:Uncharacterized protein n=1 Tax=Cryoendolithus antarcticus TaxID=1507870 RepID=A0A1V8SPY5_9PEZI|nr:hypothetical protein B0A48_13456 [Cryoendolithus antarcticus]